MILPDSPQRHDLLAAIGDRYEIDGEIARGGMGIVYRATDKRYVRTVAIKVLLPEMSEAIDASRFEREIAIVSRLQHPHIVPLYESGTAGGSLYYVMPFIEGESLRALLERERQLSLARALKIAGEIAEALGFAHDHDVVHRDVKPENILLTGGSAVIADFGIARPAGAHVHRLTTAGLSLGTPTYMSPEQVDGSMPVGPASDVYSLGCVLYEMLAGEPPYIGATTQALLAKHVMATVPSVRMLRRTVPAAVDAAIARAMAKSPVDRFPTARAFHEALVAGMARGEGDVRPVWRRTLWPATAVALVVAVIAVIAVVAITRPWAGARVPMVAVMPFGSTGDADDKALADGLTEEITSRLARVSGLGVISLASVSRYDTLGKSFKMIGSDLGVEYLVSGTVLVERRADGVRTVRVIPHLTRISDARETWTDRYEAKLVPGAVISLQASIAENVARTLGRSLLPPERAALAAIPSENWAAYDVYMRGAVFQSRPVAEEPARLAIEMFTRAVQLDSTSALAWAKLAEAHSVYFFYFDHSPARAGQASDAARRALAIDSTQAESRLAIGFVYYWVHQDWDRALAEFTAVRASQPNNSQLLSAMASVYRRQGRFELAIDVDRQALKLNPRAQQVATDLGITYLAVRQFADAERVLDQAIALAPDAPLPYIMKAFLYVAWKGDRERARATMREAGVRVGRGPLLGTVIGRVRHLLPLLGEEFQAALAAIDPGRVRIDSAQYYLAKAEWRWSQSRAGEARALFDSARVLLERRALVRADDGNVAADLSYAYAGLGRKAESMTAAQRARELLPVSRDAYFAPFMFGFLTQAYVLNGNYDAALDLMEYLLKIPCLMTPEFFRADPSYAPMRDLARFRRIAGS